MKAQISRPQSIAEIAVRFRKGTQSFDPACREFLDEWQFMDKAARIAALTGEPPHVDAVHDAYLAALAEHLALSDRIGIPDWTGAPGRFLSEPFFSGGLESLKAILLAESPPAFRRRLIFISADGLSRPDRRNADQHASPQTIEA